MKPRWQQRPIVLDPLFIARRQRCPDPPPRSHHSRTCQHLWTGSVTPHTRNKTARYIRYWGYLRLSTHSTVTPCHTCKNLGRNCQPLPDLGNTTSEHGDIYVSMTLTCVAHSSLHCWRDDGQQTNWPPILSCISPLLITNKYMRQNAPCDPQCCWYSNRSYSLGISCVVKCCSSPGGLSENHGLHKATRTEDRKEDRPTSDQPAHRDAPLPNEL